MYPTSPGVHAVDNRTTRLEATMRLTAWITREYGATITTGHLPPGISCLWDKHSRTIQLATWCTLDQAHFLLAEFVRLVELGIHATHGRATTNPRPLTLVPAPRPPS